MIDVSTTRGRIIAASLRVAAERPWSQVCLRDIAEASSTPLDLLRREFESKSAIARAFVRQIDDLVLAKAPRHEPGTSPRDRLFEVVMARLDALAPYREAVRSIVKGGPSSPRDLAGLLKSQAWMLHAAGISPEGPLGPAKVAGLASAYAATLRVWLDDDDPGHARTMAVLDRRLRSGERSLSTLEDLGSSLCRFSGMFRRTRPTEKSTAPTPAASGTPPPGEATTAPR